MFRHKELDVSAVADTAQRFQRGDNAYELGEEDMDLSSDNEDDTKPTACRYSTPAASDLSSREPTPALSVDCSDSESTTTDQEVSPWSPVHYDSPAAAHQVIGLKAESLLLSSPEFKTFPHLVPLFLPSPCPSPHLPNSEPVNHSLDAVPLRLESRSGLLPKPVISSVPPQHPSCPVRSFLKDLRRPLEHHLSTFYDIGVRTQEDIHALSRMPSDWEIVQAELSARGVTLMEWLYIKAGLEKTRHNTWLTGQDAEYPLCRRRRPQNIHVNRRIASQTMQAFVFI